MVDLVAKTPFESAGGGTSGPERLEVGGLVAVEVDVGPITEVAPLPGQGAALSEVLKGAHGVPFPAPGESFRGDSVDVIWFGRQSALLIGVAPVQAVSEYAAVTDQSDGWAVVDLTGAGAEAVLARLIPIDLRNSVFPVGSSARTLCNHMACSVTRRGAEHFRLMVFRSMVRTLFKELDHAMVGVAARIEGTGAG